MVLKNKYYILIVLISLLGCKPIHFTIEKNKDEKVYFSIAANESELDMFSMNKGSANLFKSFDENCRNQKSETIHWTWEKDEKNTDEIYLYELFTNAYTYPPKATDTLVFNKTKSCFVFKNSNKMYCSANQLPRKSKAVLKEALMKAEGDLEVLFPCSKPIEVTHPPHPKRIKRNDTLQ